MTANDVLLAGEAAAIVRSELSQRLLAMVRRVASSTAAVLIEGETGSGKEMVARAVHQFSQRRARPWVDVNCGALPEHLVESELFGYEKGAFSGAEQGKPGMFELAHGGTLFLDEVGELDARVQTKLLRVLDGAPYYRLGGTRKVSVDVRVVAATNRNLDVAVKQGAFRKDLYYRLSQIHLHVPPLRERPEEVTAIAEHLLEEHRPGVTFSDDAMAALCAYSWPGNVRELKNVVIRLAVMSESEHEIIRREDLPAEIAAGPDAVAARESHVPMGDLDSMERVMIERALESCGGDQGHAADHLGISRRTLSRKLKQFKLESSAGSLGSLGMEQQRYFRAALDRPVTVKAGAHVQSIANTVNVSATGIGIQGLRNPFQYTGIIDLEFSVADSEPPIVAKGKMSWADAQGRAGVRFVSIAAEGQRQLESWLEQRCEAEGWAQVR